MLKYKLSSLNNFITKSTVILTVVLIIVFLVQYSLKDFFKPVPPAGTATFELLYKVSQESMLPCEDPSQIRVAADVLDKIDPFRLNSFENYDCLNVLYTQNHKFIKNNDPVSKDSLYGIFEVNAYGPEKSSKIVAVKLNGEVNPGLEELSPIEFNQEACKSILLNKNKQIIGYWQDQKLTVKLNFQKNNETSLVYRYIDRVKRPYNSSFFKNFLEYAFFSKKDLSLRIGPEILIPINIFNKSQEDTFILYDVWPYESITIDQTNYFVLIKQNVKIINTCGLKNVPDINPWKLYFEGVLIRAVKFGMLGLRD